MSLLASRADFEPATPEEGAAALYYNPADGQGYRAYPFFQERLDALKGRAAPNGQKLAVWGCGWGYLVQLAVQAGYDAYGFDASTYAVNKAKALSPALAGRFFVRDALVSGDVNGARGDAGLRGKNAFALLVTEDLLTCMSDAEVGACLPLLRGICSANLLHIVTVADPTATQDSRVNWKAPAQWKALLSPPDVVCGADGVQL